MDLDLTGRTALITGGSAGIGLAAAQRLAREGCAIHIAARGAQRLEASRAVIEQSGARVAVHVADLADPAAPDRLLDACGDIDVLVNNAGAFPSVALAKPRRSPILSPSSPRTARATSAAAS